MKDPRRKEMNEIMKAIIDILGTDVSQLPLFKSRKVKHQPIIHETGRFSSGFTAVSSHKGPKRINEDRICSGSSWGLHYMVIADGLGGYPHGGDAAQIAVNTFQSQIKDIKRKDQPLQCTWIKQVYQRAAKQIKKAASNARGWKTTLLCVIERPEDFLISYLGDGQIYLIRGDAEIAVPLMVGHRVGGLLAGVLGPELTAEPVTMQLSKSFRSGEIIVAGSDGVFNPEIQQVKPDLLMDLIKCYKDQIKTEEPTAILFRFLDQLHTQNLLDDNASLGLIVTGNARQYLFQGDNNGHRN
jgi:serine/threonine protein phosphatase PrpC